MRSPNEAITDVDMEAFLLAAAKYKEAMQTLGTAVNMILGDFDKNFAVVDSCVHEDPERRRTLRSFLQAELDSNRHSVGQGAQCQLNDPSGACQLQWLLRGLEFVFCMLKLLFDGDQQAALHAYEQTLKQYHSWFTSLGIKAALLGMPSREGICSITALGPGLRDPGVLSRAVSRDVFLAVSAMLPIVQFMVATSKEFGLWDISRV